MKTATTPSGSLIPPLDLGAILIGAGAGFYARTMVPGPDAAQFIAQAIRHPGFAVVEIHELCPPYATKYEGITVKDLKGLPERTGRPFGIIKEDASRRTFFDGYKVTASRLFELPAAKAIIPDPALRKLDRLTQVVIGGKAGEHVQSAASIAAAAATAAGLYVTLRSDNPVTVGTGFSIAELTLSPEPIHYMGLAQPDLVILVAEEGQRELEGKELFSRKDKTSRVVVDVTLRPPSGVQAEERDLRVRFGPKNAALGALIEEIDRVRWWDAEAWLKAFARLADKPQQDAKRVFEIIHGKEKTI
jgi:hypothetical protein